MKRQSRAASEHPGHEHREPPAPASPARLTAIFDWEMATIGDPLADLGYLCTLWVDRDDPPMGMFELSAVTREEGFPKREELAAGTQRPAVATTWRRARAFFRSSNQARTRPRLRALISSSFPSAKPAPPRSRMGRMLLAKVEARTGKDMYLTQSKSHGDYNVSVIE